MRREQCRGCLNLDWQVEVLEVELQCGDYSQEIDRDYIDRHLSSRGYYFHEFVQTFLHCTVEENFKLILNILSFKLSILPEVKHQLDRLIYIQRNILAHINPLNHQTLPRQLRNIVHHLSLHMFHFVHLSQDSGLHNSMLIL